VPLPWPDGVPGAAMPKARRQTGPGGLAENLRQSVGTGDVGNYRSGPPLPIKTMA
jgi:hypothetical protein